MKKTLVFGASLKPDRYSYMALSRLVAAGVETLAFGLQEGEVSGVKISTDLGGITEIHTVTLYLSPKIQEGYYDDIIRLSPKRVIFNPGTENPKFYALLKNKGIEVDIACTLVLLGTGQY